MDIGVGNAINNSNRLEKHLISAARDPFEHLLGYQLRRLSLVVMADFAAALHPLGLRPVEASVLFAIGAGEGVTQSEVGRILAIKRANMVPLIALLDRRGAVRREAVDGRSWALRLTPEGRRLHDAALAAAGAHEQRLFARIEDTERARLAALLHQLWAAADPPEAGDDGAPAASP